MQERGFSLIELLIVVAIILVISAIAIPSFLHSKIAANEASAVYSIRTINTAQVTYNTTYPTIGYASDSEHAGGAGNRADELGQRGRPGLGPGMYHRHLPEEWIQLPDYQHLRSSHQHLHGLGNACHLGGHGLSRILLGQHESGPVRSRLAAPTAPWRCNSFCHAQPERRRRVDFPAPGS